MTEAQLTRRVDQWRTRMYPLGLAQYEITVSIAEVAGDNPEADATIHVDDQYDTADVEFKRDFIEACDDDSLDRVIIHELLHIAFHDLMMSTQTIEDQLSQPVGEVWMKGVNRAQEGVIERLARTIHAMVVH